MAWQPTPECCCLQGPASPSPMRRSASNLGDTTIAPNCSESIPSTDTEYFRSRRLFLSEHKRATGGTGSETRQEVAAKLALCNVCNESLFTDVQAIRQAVYKKEFAKDLCKVAFFSTLQKRTSVSWDNFSPTYESFSKHLADCNILLARHTALDVRIDVFSV